MNSSRMFYCAAHACAIAVSTAAPYVLAVHLLVAESLNSFKAQKIARSVAERDVRAVSDMLIHAELFIGSIGTLMLGASLLPVVWLLRGVRGPSEIPAGETLWFGGGVGMAGYSILYFVAGTAVEHIYAWSVRLPFAGFVAALIVAFLFRKRHGAETPATDTQTLNCAGWMVSTISVTILVPLGVCDIMVLLGIEV